MRIIIAGSRDFNDYNLLKINVTEVLNNFFLSGLIHADLQDVKIISGNARGADKLGERFAKDNNIGCQLFPANWEAYGKSAGYKRNMEMAIYARKDNGVLIAFWDGKSKGTEHMINIARNEKIKVFVIDYKGEV